MVSVNLALVLVLVQEQSVNVRAIRLMQQITMMMLEGVANALHVQSGNERVPLFELLISNF